MSLDNWSLKGKNLIYCNCDYGCPCESNANPTHGECTGIVGFQIDEGHFGDVDLDGVTFIVTFNIGNWTKLYFSDEASEEQVAATVELLRKQSGFLYGDLLEVERVPLELERSGARIAYSTPQTNTVIEAMLGIDDEPIQVTNLRFRDYTQFESETVSHTAEDESQSFEYAGTNGFTANYAAAGS